MPGLVAFPEQSIWDLGRKLIAGVEICLRVGGESRYILTCVPTG